MKHDMKEEREREKEMTTKKINFNFFLSRIKYKYTIDICKQHGGFFSFNRQQSVGDTPTYGVIGGKPLITLK